jgi:hypothetical protein
MGEMQNGYRQSRRGDDCIFMLTTAIEIARKERRGLIATFLDATKAYDRVDRSKLWEVLETLGMNKTLIELLQVLYKDNRVLLKVGKHTSDMVEQG